MKVGTIGLVMVALASLSRAAGAQVNMEPLRKRVKAVGYSVLIEGSLTGDTGNTQGIQAGGGAGAGWAHAPHRAFIYGRADYSRFNGATQMNKTFAHARYDYEFTEWLWGEAFVQAQTDAFQRLKLRNLIGTGPRFRVVHAEGLDGFLGTAYMLERDVIDIAPGSGDRRDFLIARWSSYATAHWELDARVSLATTMYVQPALSDFSNVRLLSETLFTFKVTKLLAATVTGTVRYDSAPPTAVKSTDAEVKNSLTLTF